MKRKLMNWTMALLFVASTGGAALTVAAPQPTYARCNDHLLTFPAWYRGLTDSHCNIKPPRANTGGLSKFIWTIALNVIEFLLQLVGYVSVGYIIAGGFKYMTAAGEAAKMAGARKTIMNAVIGLVLSIFSVAIINLVAGAID